MADTTPHIQRVIKSLGSEVCPACKSKKAKGMAFCYSCFKSLPPRIAKALYKSMRDGFLDAFDEAMTDLQGRGIGTGKL